MAIETNTENKPSIRLGRDWLAASGSEMVVAPTKVDSSVSSPPSIETVGISIPDVSNFHAESGGGFDKKQTLHSEIVANALAGVSGISNDLLEPPEEWVDDGQKTSTRTPPQEDPSPNKNSLNHDAVDSLCVSILERFPLGDPTVLLFVGSEPNQHVDETSARVASNLAELKIGRILLLDSDLKSRSLTRASGLSRECGICDVTNRDLDWKGLVFSGTSTMMDFMPGGTETSFRHPDQCIRLTRALAEMKQKYQFIIVSAGDAHEKPAKIWSELSDGSYLLVSMKTTNEIYAKSAVTELQTSGARLLGCVVTDAK